MILKTIKSPKDLKKLNFEDLNILSDEIREKIIEVLSINGGHLSSNLGIVELTLALHYVFDSPSDKFMFDVSHQTYTHKIITNRLEKFSTIRTHKGLSGFAHPKESIHDHFYAGHAGSALSLALGMSISKDHVNSKEHILPILGDASLTCGLTLEALNNIDEKTKRLIVILNDNNMAISKNVGNIKNILSRLLNNPVSNKLYLELQGLLSKIPTYGKLIAKQGRKVTESIKNLVSPATFFEQQNLSYIGPIDGHNIKNLVETLSAIKDQNNPILLHVITQKGKGMSKAIKNPTSYHGVKPFDKVTGDFISKSKKTFPKVFGSHVLEMANKDPNIFVVNPAMLQGSSLNEFFQKFPNRCFDVGIAEGHAITFSAGIASNKNLKVITSVYSTFLQRGVDNIFQDVCLQEIPIVFAIDRAGISGPDGATHHGIYDISFLNAMPNMIIAQPRNANLLKEILNCSFSFKKPLAIRYPNLEAEETSNELRKLKLNSYDILSNGEKILIISVGQMYKTALQVKENLLKENLNATVLDPIFIKPINKELFKELLATHDSVITLEEHALSCGFGSIFNNFLVQNNFNNVKVLNFGINDNFVQHGKNEELLKDLGLDSESITKKILTSIEKKHFIQGSFL